MTTLFIITLILLGVSAFFNYVHYRAAKFYRAAYRAEVRKHTFDNLLAATACLASLALHWITRKKE